MKLDAVGVTSNNLQKSVAFYNFLGFTFPVLNKEDQHIEAINTEGSIRLMMDKAELIKTIIGEDPKPANHSIICISYETQDKVNEICQKIKTAGYKVFKEPWDAFWGQRYAIVEDPDGYKIDLYASLS